VAKIISSTGSGAGMEESGVVEAGAVEAGVADAWAEEAGAGAVNRSPARRISTIRSMGPHLFKIPALGMGIA
jgi:hypothetical protein